MKPSSGPQLDRAVQHRLRAVEVLALVDPAVAEIVEDERLLRLELERLQEVGLGRGPALGPLERDAAGVEQAPVPTLDLGQPLDGLGCRRPRPRRSAPSRAGDRPAPRPHRAGRAPRRSSARAAPTASSVRPSSSSAWASRKPASRASGLAAGTASSARSACGRIVLAQAYRRDDEQPARVLGPNEGGEAGEQQRLGRALLVGQRLGDLDQRVAHAVGRGSDGRRQRASPATAVRPGRRPAPRRVSCSAAARSPAAAASSRTRRATTRGGAAPTSPKLVSSSLKPSRGRARRGRA